MHLSPASLARLFSSGSVTLVVRGIGDGLPVLDASDSTRDTLGCEPAELIATAYTERVHPDDLAAFELGFREALAAGKDRFVLADYRLRHADGSWVWVQDDVRVEPDPEAAGGSSVCTIACLIDVTERRRVRDELDQQCRHLEARVALAERLESIGQLAAGIAHEINTPTQYVGHNTRFLEESFAELSPLLGLAAELAASILREEDAVARAEELERALEAADFEELGREIPKAIRQSLEGIGHVGRIVQAMKEFSHPGGEERTWVDLNHAVESTITVATNEWKYRADLELDLEPGLPALSCRAGELNQVLLNLIVNAAQAIGGERDEKRGRIGITTRCVGEQVEVRISDTGPGIPEEIRGRIFDPFFTTKEVGRGTGQGLSIVHEVVVENHGGSIELETEPGQGTTFIVRLPLGAETEVEESAER